MHKIKILQCHNFEEENWYGSDYSSLLKQLIVSGITDWEDVDDDTYHKLIDWISRKNYSDVRNKNIKYAIFEYSNFNVPKAIEDFKQIMEREKKEKEKQEKERKKRESERKKKTIERKKKQLEKLKKELDNV